MLPLFHAILGRAGAFALALQRGHERGIILPVVGRGRASKRRSSMEITMRKVSELTPYEKNAKTHDKVQIDNVAQSIKELGWLQPIVVDRDGVVVVGHCRLLAAKKLKQKEVPCVIADDLTDEQIKKYRVLDNKLNESPWDLHLLAEDVEGLDFSGYEVDFGIDDCEIEEPKAKEREEAAFHESISVVIDCENDEEAQAVFEHLSEEGYKCRISTL